MWSRPRPGSWRRAAGHGGQDHGGLVQVAVGALANWVEAHEEPAPTRRGHTRRQFAARGLGRLALAAPPCSHQSRVSADCGRHADLVGRA